MHSIIASIFTLAFASSAHASGFTWLSGVSHSTHIQEHILTFILVIVVLVVLGLIYRAKTANVKNLLIPDAGVTLRNIFEAYAEWILGLGRSILGDHKAKVHFNFYATIFILIFVNNAIGLIPGFLPATENLNTTLAIGMFVFVYFNVYGIKEQGFINYFKHFMGPLALLAPLIFVIEIVSLAVRPISLGLRLRGNMSGDHIVLGIFSELVPLGIPVVFMGLGLFVSFVQAFVFTLLTIVYIGLATDSHAEEGHH
jgi:F-type H+-transporting ATPase subunit a